MIHAKLSMIPVNLSERARKIKYKKILQRYRTYAKFHKILGLKILGGLVDHRRGLVDLKDWRPSLDAASFSSLLVLVNV